MPREVTEQDLRAPQFKGMKVEDLEFRDSGDIVRKDRWETALRRIAGAVVGSRSKFECDDVADAVDKLVTRDEGWIKLPQDDPDDYPADGAKADIRLKCGSELRGVIYHTHENSWSWKGFGYDPVAWRDPA